MPFPDHCEAPVASVASGDGDGPFEVGTRAIGSGEGIGVLAFGADQRGRAALTSSADEPPKA